MTESVDQSNHRCKPVHFEDLIEFKMRLSSYQYSYLAARAQDAGISIGSLLRKLALRAACSDLEPPSDYSNGEPHASSIKNLRALGDGEWVSQSSIGSSVAALLGVTEDSVYAAVQELLVMGILDGNVNMRDELIIAW